MDFFSGELILKVKLKLCTELDRNYIEVQANCNKVKMVAEE